MKVKHWRNLALEGFTFINNFNPEYIKEIFHESRLLRHRPLSLQVDQTNATNVVSKVSALLGISYMEKTLKIYQKMNYLLTF